MGLNKRLIGAGAIAGAGGLTPSENFKVVLYTGNSGTQAITGVGFKPDFVWIKERSQAENHNLTNSSRGTNKILNSNNTSAEITSTSRITSFDSDGFTLGNNNETNDNGDTYVAWCWKANGGTTASNSDGTITSTVQANTDAGFSIVKYTGNATDNATVGHGLSQTPELYILKNLDATHKWPTHTQDVGSLSGNQTGALNLSEAFSSYSKSATSTVLTFSTNADRNPNGQDMIAYCFHSVDGFSKFGSYTGNGSANGQIVETGFEPAFLMIKDTTVSAPWIVLDNKRNTSNPRNNTIYANLANAESVTTVNVNFLSNGFELTTADLDVNRSGSTFIYMAFATDADTEAPTLASSFNIEEYTGNSNAAVTVNGLGFAPNLVWAKSRTPANEHNLYDTIRGATFKLKSNATSAQESSGALDSFTSDGFTLRSGGYSLNQDNNTYVAWSWKADDNEPTILPNTELTSLISKYKFNDNVDDDYGDNNATASNLSFVSGKFKKAADFNGSSSKITYPQAAPFNDSNGIIAISAWVKLDSASDEFVLMSASSTSDQNVSVGLHVGGNKAGRVFISNAASNQQEVQANFGSTNNTNWNHYVWQLSSSNGIELWFNGVSQTRTQTYQAGSITTGSWFGDLTYPTNVQYATGINRVVTTAYYEGEVAQMRLFNAELTSSEISSLYNEANEAIVSANANAGFSIVKWEGDGVATSRVPHGLSAKPDMVIVKNLSSSGNWNACHVGLASNEGIALDLSGAAFTGMGSNGGITYANLNATTFGFATGSVGVDSVNKSGDEFIAYCWHSVSSYSKFGSYEGNQTLNTDNVVNFGFKADFVMIKNVDEGGSQWMLLDTRRENGMALYANTDAAEADYTGDVTITSQGLRFGSTNINVNKASRTYLYMAIAKNVPSNTTLANSFKAVTYSGTASSQAITTGFTPDLVWIKRRNATDLHVWTDSVRGTNKQLFSNQTDAQSVTSTRLTTFDANGFTLSGSGTRVNESGGTYVAWCWKAGNTWQSNLDGSSPSTVNVNTANGFSIVKYVGNQTAGHTIGHGLGAVPEVIILKCLDSTNPWYVYHVGVDENYPAHYNLRLQATDARQDSLTEFNDTAPTSSVFTLGTASGPNKTDNEYIAYCWTPKSGYSKFGSYTGNGTASGPVVTTGFQPDFLMVKRTDSTSDWGIIDTSRGSHIFPTLFANKSDAELTSGDNRTWIEFISTGFQPKNGDSPFNTNSGKYIYMAFKMN